MIFEVSISNRGWRGSKNIADVICVRPTNYLILLRNPATLLLAVTISEVPVVRLSVDGFKVAVPTPVDGPGAIGRRRRCGIIGVAIGHVVFERRRLNGGVLAEGAAVGPRPGVAHL